LWAYDGTVPGGDDALQATWGEAGLTLGTSSGQAPVPARPLGSVRVEGSNRRCLVLRASACDASFVLVG
ncbi:MAG: hypothetical protein H5U40_16355, partial [Polyangiaceae bacterium]|nr:hypothetical protein [Polyangiaceae bacterium]